MGRGSPSHRIHSLNFPPISSTVEMIINNNNDEDVNDNDKRKMMLDLYEQCEYKM